MNNANATPELNKSAVNWSHTGSAHATPFSSPTKLAPHHNIFMANLQKSPTSKGNALFGETPRSSSTKVIESLHEQIEILNKTNLQLSTQSQGLLTKLEDTHDKEAKLVKNLSGLKNENETLKNLLTRETDHLKDLEASLTNLNEQCNDLNKENKAMKSELANNNQGEESLDEELLMVESQYRSLVDAQAMTKSHYDNEIAQLKEDLETLTIQHTNAAERIQSDSQKLIDAITALSTENKEYQEMYKTHNDSIDRAFQQELNYGPGTDNENPTEQYNILKQELIDIGAEMDVSTVERDLIDLQTVKLQRVRNVSNSGSNAAKRTSFYGSMSPVPDSHTDGNRIASPIIGLPGVKRSLSKRRVVTPSMTSASEIPGVASPSLRRNRGNNSFQ